MLLGDSLVANMSRYPIVWGHHLEKLNVVNCGIRGDHTQNVLWRVEHMYLPATVSVALIHCGINDINGTSANVCRPHEIAENVILCGLKLRERHPLMSIIIVGILPAEKTFWGRKSRIEQVNFSLHRFCSFHGFLSVEPSSCWRDSSGNINQSLYWKDGLHLNKNGCNRLASIYSYNNLHFAAAHLKEIAHLHLHLHICRTIRYNIHMYHLPLDLQSNSIYYHRCHHRPRKIKKPPVNHTAPTAPAPTPTGPTATAPNKPNILPDNVNNVSDNSLYACLVPVKYFRLSVVFMFMSVYIVLLFCGLGGELNGNYIHVKGIYFDYHDFVCILGVLFVANLEGVFCQFLSGTSGVKWNLYNDRKKRKKIKGILIDVKNIFLICLTLIWVCISYQTLHHQCGDTTSKDQPPELQAKKKEFGFEFVDFDKIPQNSDLHPKVHHFRSSSIPSIIKELEEHWNYVLKNKICIPAQSLLEREIKLPNVFLQLI